MRLNGKDIAEKIYQSLKDRVSRLKITPHLVVFLIGENPASVAYVNQKEKKGTEIGCKITVLRLPETVTTEELEKKITLLNEDPFTHGILIQRPVPTHIDIDKLELLTNPEKDIDGFHPDSPYTFPIPLAVIEILKYCYSELVSESQTNKSEIRNPKSETNPNIKNVNDQNISNLDIRYSDFISWLKNQEIVIIGKGPTGGGAIINYFKKLSINHTIIDSKTENPKEILKNADIIISAVGKENIVRAEDLKRGVILVGVGILRGADGKLHGDYNENEIESIASYYTPTPGGVGPVNVAMLMVNLLNAAETQNKT